jgi:hypothetical protein
MEGRAAEVTYEIWYMRPAYFADGIMGYNFLNKYGKLPDFLNLDKTHALARIIVREDSVSSAILESIFVEQQAHNWGKDADATNDLLESKGLQHTSMSCGDIVRVVETNAIYMVDTFGFKVCN